MGKIININETPIWIYFHNRDQGLKCPLEEWLIDHNSGKSVIP